MDNVVSNGTSPSSAKAIIEDSDYLGDQLLDCVNNQQTDMEMMKHLLHRLKCLFCAASMNASSMDEERVIEILFTHSDVEFANEARPTELSSSAGATPRIRQMEVSDNSKPECETDSNSDNEFPLANPYLNSYEFAQATLCCCYSLLEWLLERIEKPIYGTTEVHFPRELVCSFVRDLSSTGLISGFCKAPQPREKQSFTREKFEKIEVFALFGKIPDNPVRETMAIFSLRQVLESWFMRIVGFRGVIPLESFEIRSSKLQRIIEKDFETALSFQGGSPVKFQSIQQIYKWTQASIHWAYSTNIWLIWKAITYCERLFGATINYEGLEKYRTAIIKLCLEEAKFVKASQSNAPKKSRPTQRMIIFREPDIFVTKSNPLIGKLDKDEQGFSLLERNVTIRQTPPATNLPPQEGQSH